APAARARSADAIGADPGGCSPRQPSSAALSGGTRWTPSVAALGSHDHYHLPAFQPGRPHDDPHRREPLRQLLQPDPGQIAVDDLPDPEANGKLHLVPVLEEALGVAELHHEIMLVDLGRHAQLLDVHDLLPLARFPLPAALFVAKL